NDARMQNGFDPVLHEPGQGPAGIVAEQRGAVRVAAFEVFRDRRRIVHDTAVVDDHRYPPLIRLRQPVFLGEPPGHGLDLELLMRERHAGAPAKRAEPSARLGAGKIVEHDRRDFLRRCWDRRPLWPAPGAPESRDVIALTFEPALRRFSGLARVLCQTSLLFSIAPQLVARAMLCNWLVCLAIWGSVAHAECG